MGYPFAALAGEGPRRPTLNYGEAGWRRCLARFCRRAPGTAVPVPRAI